MRYYYLHVQIQCIVNIHLHYVMLTLFIWLTAVVFPYPKLFFLYMHVQCTPYFKVPITHRQYLSF